MEVDEPPDLTKSFLDYLQNRISNSKYPDKKIFTIGVVNYSLNDIYKEVEKFQDSLSKDMLRLYRNMISSGRFSSNDGVLEEIIKILDWPVFRRTCH